MKTSHIFIVLLFTLLMFNGCSLPERKGASIEAGSTFIDDTPPSLRIEFPFPISLVKQESSIEGGEGGLKIFVTNYALKQLGKSTTIFISRQSLPESDGHFSSFRGADDAQIREKIFLEKHINGFCSINEQKIEDNIFFVITIVRYSARKKADIIRIYNFIEKSYFYDYTLGKIKGDNKEVLNEVMDTTKILCSQLRENGLKPIKDIGE